MMGMDQHAGMYERSLELPEPGQDSFFLWGPRQVGKSTLLRQRYPEGENIWVDLLLSNNFSQYSQNPENLRLELEANPPSADTQIVIDEIQAVPGLLGEVHWMMENRGYKFALCSSSPIKLIRQGGNLLGGRGRRYNLRGMTSGELGADFDLQRILNVGYFPAAYQSGSYQEYLNSYVGDYLRQEIAQEGLVRNLPRFRNFLDTAALRDASGVTMSNIASECAVSEKTVKNYFGILEDTKLGQWLPAYSKTPKGREVMSPKFYFCDVGMVNFLAQRGEVVEGGSRDFGKAFENWVFHELSTYLAYNNQPMSQDNRLSYWGQHNGPEVDFLVGDWLAVEAKSSQSISGHHLKGLRALHRRYPSFEMRIVVCRTPRAMKLDDGILVLPYQDFCKQLWEGQLIRL